MFKIYIDLNLRVKYYEILLCWQSDELHHYIIDRDKLQQQQQQRGRPKIGEHEFFSYTIWQHVRYG